MFHINKDAELDREQYVNRIVLFAVWNAIVQRSIFGMF